jgi:pyruvate,orthophosphate dikinase
MKLVYFFGNGAADGGSHKKDLLGGKGANLAEMTNLNIPVPPGFTITTDVCRYFMDNQKLPNELKQEVMNSINKIEKMMMKKFGDNNNPLLVSIRSGAMVSMPGMMETVLNVGLTEATVQGLAESSGNPRFAYDSYRRLIMMYADVVIEKSNNITSDNGQIRHRLEKCMDRLKESKNYKKDTDLNENDLMNLCSQFKQIIKETFGKEFPDNAEIQLWDTIKAVFLSWNGNRAKSYRKIEKISNRMGTAVNVQSMVFGNMGAGSATGVAFTRNPSTGENIFYGEWLENAQGEDVVAGIRTPNPLNNESKSIQSEKLVSLEEKYPILYKQLYKIKNNLEMHYKDMQDIEFTIENQQLWMLQTRRGKRNGVSAIKIAFDLKNEQMIDEKEIFNRISSDHLNEIMLPIIDEKEEAEAKIIARGLPAGPGGATGQIIFSANDAEKLHADGNDVILVRKETSPEDVHGMYAAQGILTSRGGMTSHAALVARGWGKCCIVGCSDLMINYSDKSVVINNHTYKEGDWITLNGSLGTIYNKKLSLVSNNMNDNPLFKKIMNLTEKYQNLGVRANADTEKDALNARELGAEGLGLCRTEHMFFSPNRILSMRKMILATTLGDRQNALDELLPHQQKDFYGILKAMAPYPVTIRLLDPPLHEFLPQTNKQIEELASELNVNKNKINQMIESLHETNPMLGHRGCRLGITYPEITIMQAQAIFNASQQLIEEGLKPSPEIMIPLVGTDKEFIHQKKLIQSVYDSMNLDMEYKIGTMIELPRACLIADKIAKHADFFSFGTNDLTQTTFGYSRDDMGSFIYDYLNKSMLPGDPFESIDVDGVGSLVKMAVNRGKKENQNLKIGICGEHGGDPKSIEFFHKIGLHYVSCSPFRVPIARLSSAQCNNK